jgi:hypothetical protein
MRRQLQKWNMRLTKGSGHTTETITQAVKELRVQYPLLGGRLMKEHLFWHYGMKVTQCVNPIQTGDVLS